MERKQRLKASREAWISKGTWQTEDRKAGLQRAGIAITRDVRKARRDFQRALLADRRRRVQVMGTSIVGLLESGRVKEAWEHLVLWYRHPTRKDLD